jgi:hypothetical protein
MQKVTSYKKLSKKKQKELNAKKRKNWGELKPTVRVVESKKHYNRKRKTRAETDDFRCESFLFRNSIY